MATHTGKEGVIKVGANTIAQVKSWSLEQSSDTAECTTMGDSSRSYLQTLTTGSGSIECFWDETDTTGQIAIANGSSVTLNLYPEGDTSGDNFYTFSAIITGETVSTSFDGLCEASFTFQVTGDITRGDVA